MNVNPASQQFTEVVPWDSLTDEQKASGDWIELPAKDTDVGRQARKKTTHDTLHAMFAKVSDAEITAELPGIFGRMMGEFDASGKAR